MQKEKAEKKNIHEVKTIKRSKSTGNKFENKKDGGRNVENFFLAFKDVSWKFSSRWLPLAGSGQVQRKTDCGGFKGRQEMSRYQVVIVRHFCKLIFPRKSTQVKIHTKMAIFGWFLARKTQ